VKRSEEGGDGEETNVRGVSGVNKGKKREKVKVEERKERK
jgi:hypothetical protein